MFYKRVKNKKTILGLVISIMLAQLGFVPKSQAAIGGAIGLSAIAGVSMLGLTGTTALNIAYTGSVLSGTGGIINFGCFWIDAFSTRPTWCPKITSVSIIGIMAGAVLLDDFDHSNLTLKFKPLSRPEAQALKLTYDEWTYYNLELDQLNMISESVSQNLIEAIDQSKIDANQAVLLSEQTWTELLSVLSIDTQSAVRKLVKIR